MIRVLFVKDHTDINLETNLLDSNPVVTETNRAIVEQELRNQGGSSGDGRDGKDQNTAQELPSTGPREEEELRKTPRVSRRLDLGNQ